MLHQQGSTTLFYHKLKKAFRVLQNSKSLIVNYSRSLAYIALHFSRPPHQVSVEGSGLAILSLFTARFTPLFFLPSQPIFQTDYKALWHYDIKNIKI